MNKIRKNTKDQQICRKKRTRKDQKESSVRLETDGTISVNNVPLLNEAYANGTKNVHIFLNEYTGSMGIEPVKTNDPFVFDLTKENNHLVVSDAFDIQRFLGFKKPMTCPMISVDDWFLDAEVQEPTRMAYFNLGI